MKGLDRDSRDVVQRAARRLLPIPGVHLVAIGGRERGGRATGELAIIVYLEQKRPRAEVPQEELIPREIEGLPTDVIATPPFYRAVTPGRPPVPPGERYIQGDFDRYRPIRGGTQLSAADRPGAGTLGFLARVPADPKRIMAVTCHHVVYDTVAMVPNRKCGQPNPSESSTKCCRHRIGLCVASHYDADVDAALIQLDAELEWLAEVHQIGAITGHFNLTPAESATKTYQLRMRGRTMRLTGGTLQSVNGVGTAKDRSGLPPRPFTNAIVIKPNPSSAVTTPVWFCDEGDSGAAVVNDKNEIVGLLYSANDAGWGLADHVGWVIDKFKNEDNITIEVAKATKLGQVQIVPKAAIPAPEVSPAELPEGVRRIERDLDRTERGRRLISVWLQHFEELNRLVNTHRRVAAAWRRANGPALFRLVVAAAEEPDRPFPLEFQGVPTDQALDAFLGEVDRHASPALRADLHHHRPLLQQLPGRSYGEIIRDIH
ncbi:MAG: hypothetical protein U0104_15165 [Gemmatimonadales bacterium]